MVAVEKTLTGNFFLDLATLFAVSFSGPILFWLPASTEILAAGMGRLNPAASPALVGLVCATGQCTLFALLFFFGERIASRWQWLRMRVDAVGLQRRRFLSRGKLLITLGAAVGGFPPTVPLFTLGPSLQMKLLPMLLIMFAFRYLRFAACCLLGSVELHPTDGSSPWNASFLGAYFRLNASGNSVAR
jgi:membrane protein YqaA with SNARE-associated domain